MAELTDVEREILQFETDKVVWKYQGAKVTAIYDRWRMTETRYYQVLQALLDRPEALTAFPQTVRRLLRLREVRRAARTRPTSSHDPRGYDRQPGPQGPAR